VVAFPIGDRADDPVRMYLVDIYTLPVNMAGLPAMSIPCGFATPDDSDNPLPVGLQLIGPHLSESTLLNIAHAYQQTTDWHRQRPPI
jgi:aspartyl-tRNA(Asn)/glutamyl-tRNA(Gln) amidotransferase subunit A